MSLRQSDISLQKKGPAFHSTLKVKFPLQEIRRPPYMMGTVKDLDNESELADIRACHYNKYRVARNTLI